MATAWRLDTCPKDDEPKTADDCENCVDQYLCFEWCGRHIVWGFTDHGPGRFDGVMPKDPSALGVLHAGRPVVPKYRSEKQPIPAEIRWHVWERDNFTCRHCGDRRHLSIDHIVPESKGGPTEENNLQTLCRRCNSAKGTRVE